jgi:hypothetical protein
MIAHRIDSARETRVFARSRRTRVVLRDERFHVAQGATILGEAMEIFLDKRAVRQIRLSAQDAIEEGDTETLREDLLEIFTEEQVEEIERRLDNGDFFEFLTDMLDEWSGDDIDELFELLDAQLGDVGVDVKFEKKAASPDDEEEGEPKEVEEDDDFEDDDDADDDEEDDDADEDEDEEEEKEKP